MTCALRNRGEFKKFTVVADGWFMDGVTRYPRMVSIPFELMDFIFGGAPKTKDEEIQ